MSPYTRDEYIATINDFYTLLTRLHVPKEALIHPPQDGWPNITAEAGSSTGRSEFVLDLLKHLPYIAGGVEAGVDIHYKCNVVDYSTRFPRDLEDSVMASIIWDGEEAYYPDEDAEDRWASKEMPPYTFVLAEGHESYGRALFLDTKRGKVIEEMVRAGLAGVWDVVEYFADLRNSYLTLQMMPVLGYETVINARGLDDDGEEEVPTPVREKTELDDFFPNVRDVYWIRHIYRSHGWPGPEFRREAALRRAQKYLLFRERDAEYDESEE
ncbi:hypothetical protein M426DRAFT_9396 [Hypoxylon sp. CI-4A]|nr:hypothetical protein M426DRAFT_9396 [Hypoxylon sp. CI-4A]